MRVPIATMARNRASASRQRVKFETDKIIDAKVPKNIRD